MRDLWSVNHKLPKCIRKKIKHYTVKLGNRENTLSIKASLSLNLNNDDRLSPERSQNGPLFAKKKINLNGISVYFFSKEPKLDLQI